MTREQLEQLAREWRRSIIARETLSVAAACCAAAAVAMVWFRPALSLPVALGVFVFALIVRLSHAKPWRLQAPEVARHLNRAFPQLEESCELWLRPPEMLTLVERLQLARAAAAAQQLGEINNDRSFAAPPPNFLRLPFIWLASGVALLAIVAAWMVTREATEIAAQPQAAQSPQTRADLQHRSTTEFPKIQQVEMLIVPPAYTGHPERRVSGFSAEIEEGASVSWTVTLDRDVQEFGLRFRDENMPLQPQENRAFSGSRRMSDASLYSVVGVLADGFPWTPPEIYSLKVLKDQAPSIDIAEPALPRTEVVPAAEAESPRVNVEVLASDDYGITAAHLIATVAKGTGEAVKFREQKIEFDTAEQTVQGRRFTMTFDLVALGLAPGDELYFHVEATDNREPSNNRARSETRFIVWKGPEQSVTTPGAGVSGVNLIPQYFRSQRQIIIDTEKLLADQATLTASEFRQRANNLAIDQQLLRQRYGQFLGEEADHEDVPLHAADEHEPHSADDGHDHGHDHDDGTPGGAAPRTHAEVAAQFGHQHDSQDEATLFDRETKGTMRQAIAAMWEAERYLRVAQPAEALAPENRALEILKALQQADREYVQRVGFEAAPLDVASRRLRGDVSEVPVRSVSEASAPQPGAAETRIRELLKRVPWKQGSLSPDELESLRSVEQPLTDAASDRPESFLAPLGSLRRVVAGERLEPNEWLQLQGALLRLLPPAAEPPLRNGEIAPALVDEYYRHLEAQP